jgi:GNAT superfamily N-acetyltransferase
VTARLDDLAYRRATPADAPAVAAVTVEGFETYLEFAPAGWHVPTLAEELEIAKIVLAKPSIWCRLATAGSQPVAHVGFIAAAHSLASSDDARLAHLWHLFVVRAWWGSGVATLLLRGAVTAAHEAGFETMRLFTPADHGRARRFYEREGWTMLREPGWDGPFGMPMAEYRRDLR